MDVSDLTSPIENKGRKKIYLFSGSTALTPPPSILVVSGTFFLNSQTRILTQKTTTLPADNIILQGRKIVRVMHIIDWEQKKFPEKSFFLSGPAFTPLSGRINKKRSKAKEEESFRESDGGGVKRDTSIFYIRPI